MDNERKLTDRAADGGEAKEAIRAADGDEAYETCHAADSGEAYEALIGLEIHVGIKGAGKLFCDCAAEFSATPNVHVCPVCLGYPGALPRFNRKLVPLAVRAGLMLGCRIEHVSYFDRKHYFYPDLPKGYQLTQYEHPICTGGGIGIEGDNGSKFVRIRRLHIEEDAGKAVYRPDGTMLADYNRAGVPLVEIVTEPDLASGAEAVNFVKTLRLRMLYAGISDCRMNEGSLRVDVNISLRRPGGPPGEKVELKNINSFAFMRQAIAFEFGRQREVLAAGGCVTAETRRFDESTGTTVPMRAKESTADYCYLRDADLGPVEVSDALIEAEQRSLPVFPDVKLRRYVRELGLAEADAELLVTEPGRAAFFDAVAAELARSWGTTADAAAAELARSEGAPADTLIKRQQFAAKFCISRIFPMMEKRGQGITPGQTAAVIDLVDRGELGSANALRLIGLLCGNPELCPGTVMREQELGVIRDRRVLEQAVREAVNAEPAAVNQYFAGKTQALGAVRGRCMRLTGGRAAPELLDAILAEVLAETRLGN